MPGLWPSDSLWPADGLWPSVAPFVFEVPVSWTPLRKFTPKPGTAGLRGSRSYHPAGYTLDLADVIEAGGLTTQDPNLKGALRDSGLFDESDP